MYPDFEIRIFFFFYQASFYVRRLTFLVHRRRVSTQMIWSKQNHVLTKPLMSNDYNPQDALQDYHVRRVCFHLSD